jgi:hypothetical protein
VAEEGAQGRMGIVIARATHNALWRLRCRGGLRDGDQIGVVAKLRDRVGAACGGNEPRQHATGDANHRKQRRRSAPPVAIVLPAASNQAADS